ncbi:DNA-binding transcriptional LysR family regulator [Ottowia thiooxydans]|uniref:DNA-binding transcriptional LysR family regulator n=2 Tax=Ottowia thiooxydans TaxID=219182 RepID=A0ABV2QD16_9BURK
MICSMKSAPIRPHHIALLQVLSTSSTLTEAAHRLNITQPAVSKQLSQLHEDLGYRLFERRGHTLRPTFEARALFDQIGRVNSSLLVLNELATEFRDARPGHLQIGCIPSAAIHLLPHALLQIQSANKDLLSTIHTGNTAQVIQWVDTQQVDVAIGMKVSNSEKWHYVPLLPLKLECLMVHNHPLAKLNTITASDLNGYQVIGIEYPSVVWRGEGQLPWWDQELVSVQTRVDSAHVACKMAELGMGVAIADSLSVASFANERMCRRPFRNQVRAEIGVYRATDRPGNDFAKSLVIALQRYMSSLELSPEFNLA